MNAPPRIAEHHVERRAIDSKRTVIAFTIGILAWSMDYKSSAGAGTAAAFQALLLGVYIVMLLSIAVTAIRAATGIGSVWVLLLAVLIFMVDGTILATSFERDPYTILVNLLPPFVYASACALTYVTLSIASDRLPVILTVLRVACLTYAVGHLVMIAMTRGIDVRHSRYEVFSGAAMPSLAIIALALIRRVSRLDVVIMVFNLAIALLSVTRTLFVVLLAQLAGVLVARPSSLFKGTAVRGLMLLVICGGGLAALDLAAGTGLIERWTDRLTVGERYGADPTALTRSAETHFMMESFTQSTDTLLFGNGLAARIYMTGSDAVRAAQMVGWQSVKIYDEGYGHENYVSILFIAGLLGGGGLLIVQILNGLQAIALIRRLQLTDPSCQSTAAHLGVWGALIVIGILAYGLLGAVIGDRSTCVWYGIGTGILYWCREHLEAPGSSPVKVPRVQTQGA
jgi:hypothetical protein